MEKRWWCVSCFSQMELDIHGRCGVCGSDAVDRIPRGASPMSALEQTPAPKPLRGFSLNYWRMKLATHWIGKNAGVPQQLNKL